MRIKFILYLLCVFVQLAVCGFDYRDYKDIDAKKYPDANAVLLYDYDKISYNPDGSSVEIDDYYIKVLTNKGVIDNRTIPIFFNTFYTDIEVTALEIIRVDGQVQKIDIKKHSEVVIDSSQISQNIYDPANKILKISLPFLDVNDIIHICVKENNRISRIKDVYSFIKVLQSDMPIIYYELIVEGPKEYPLKKRLIKDEVESTIVFTEKIVGDKVVYTWIARDVPMQIAEADSPPLYLFSQRILGSTAENWEEISRWYYNLCQPHLEKVTPEMKSKVEELIQNCPSDMDKIYAIFQFVSQKIRYMGVTTETEAPGYEPHDVDITFNNRYGVCRDKAALLTAMLNLAGFESYPVLFYAGYPKDSEVANNYFNHAITAVKLNGKYILMDSTDETTKELLPAYLANNSYLVAHKDGETLQLSDSISSSANQLLIENNGVYNANENILHVQSKLIFSGINDVIYRNALSRWPEGYAMQYFSMILRKINAGITLQKVEILPKNIRDMSQVLEIVLSYELKNYFDEGKGELQIIPEINLGEYIGAANMILGNMSLDERKFPMELFSTAETVEKSYWDFGNFKIKNLVLPEYIKISNGLLDFDKKVSRKENKLEVNSKFALKKKLIYPAEYKALKKSLKQIEEDNEKIIFLKTATNEKKVDTRILKDITVYDFADDFNWSKVEEREFEVLNYASIKDNAELKVYFNPIWEKVELIEAYVDNNGKIQKISANEINIMDQNVNAPAYSNGKIFTMNFPNVQLGSRVYYKVKTTATNKPYFAAAISFGSFDYIENKQVEFRNVSKNFKLNYDRLPDNIKIEKQPGTIVVSGEKIAAILPEIGSAPNYVTAPTVWVSNGVAKDFAMSVEKKIREKALVSKNVQKLTCEITRDKNNFIEKIQAIRDYVAKNIRKIDINFSSYPLEFSTPDEVLSRGYANSVDSAILLLAMLKSIDADKNCKILLLSDFKKISNCKNFWLECLTDRFTEVLLWKKNEFILNLGSQYGILNEMPPQGSCYLELDSGMIKYWSENNSKRDKIYKITLNNDNSADIELNLSFAGDYFGSINKKYQTLTSEERSRFIKDLVSNVSMRAELKSSSFKKDFASGKVVINLKLKVANFIRNSGEYSYFELSEFISLGDFIRLGAANREMPYYLKLVNPYCEEYEVKLPQNSSLISRAENINFAFPSLNYVCDSIYDETQAVLKIKNQIAATDSILSIVDYRKLLDLNLQSDRKLQKIVIFIKKSGKNLQ